MRKRRAVWNELMDEFLLKKREDGYSFRRIANILDVSYSGVQKRFQKIAGVRPRYTPSYRRHSMEVRNAVIEMKKRGLTKGQIAMKLGLRPSQVHGIWGNYRDYTVPRSIAA